MILGANEQARLERVSCEPAGLQGAAARRNAAPGSLCGPLFFFPFLHGSPTFPLAHKLAVTLDKELPSLDPLFASSVG